MEKRTYGRFYSILKNLKGYDKEDAIFDYTNGRTTHLSDLSDKEYYGLCRSLEKLSLVDAEKRKAGSNLLTLLAKLGIHTHGPDGWREIDRYLLNPRIAGKRYRELTTEERKALIPKLSKILDKQK